MKTKIEILQSNIRTKTLISNFAHDKIDTAELAYELACDEEMRTTAHVLTQKILNPTPLDSLKTERTNRYIDIGMGLSALWDELRIPTEDAVDTAIVLDNVLMNLNMGLDKDIKPNMRKDFLQRVGLSDEQVDTLVPLSDYVEFEYRVREDIRAMHMERLGLNLVDNIDAADEEMLNSLVEDSMAMDDVSLQIPADRLFDEYGNPKTYDEYYGLSAEEMYQEFSIGEVEDLDYYPEYVQTWTVNEYDDMYESLAEFHRIHEDTIEANTAELESLLQDAQQAQAPIQLSFDDLADLEYDAPELSDEDLASLEESYGLEK